MSVRQTKDELSELLRRVEAGAHIMVMRRHEAVATLIPARDYQRFQDLLGREALTRALLRGRGLDVADLTTERFIDFLDRNVGKGGMR